MRRGLLILISFIFAVGTNAQDINNKIIVPITQDSRLRIDAGNDVSLDNSGSVVIGESISVTGGTPDYTFIWTDINDLEYIEKTPLITGPGLYWLLVSDDNNCSAMDSLTVSDYGTGITNSIKNSDVDIFVEPDGKLLIAMRNISGRVKLSLISSEGLIIYQEKINSIPPEYFCRFNPGKIASGIYLISVHYNSGTLVKKIIVH